MTSGREVSTVRSPDIIVIESQNDLDNNEHEIPTFRSRNDLSHSLEDCTSSIVSDFTEGSTIHADINSPGNNLLQPDLSNNNISIKKSSEILIGSKTNFTGSVMIQNFIAGNEGQHSFVSNPDTLDKTPNSEQKSVSINWLRSLRTYVPCKSKWMFNGLVAMCFLSALGGLAVAAYFLYLHIFVYSVPGALFVCKSVDSTTCFIGSSTKSCSNIVSSDGREFISGHTTTGLCKIYSRNGCQGDRQEIETVHKSFYFGALSARC